MFRDTAFTDDDFTYKKTGDKDAPKRKSGVLLGSVAKADGSHKMGSRGSTEKINNNPPITRFEATGELIFVKSNLAQNKDGSFEVAFFENDALHPDGQIYIADDRVHQCALTTGVLLALQTTFRLVEVSGNDYIEPNDEPVLMPSDTPFAELRNALALANHDTQKIRLDEERARRNR